MAPPPNYNMVESQIKDLPILLEQDDCKGRTFIVTGGNTGIGYECAKHLVKLQAERVIITVRDQAKGTAAKEAIEKESERNGVIDVFHLDLCQYDSIRGFVRKLEAEVDRVDGVIANAGIANGAWVVNEGMEGNIQVNFIANMYLTALLVPYMQSLGQKHGIVPRITLVGSMGTFIAPTDLLADIDRDDIFNDLNNKAKWGNREMNYRYVLSKLLLHFSVRQLATLSPESTTGVVINVADPGEMGSRAILAGQGIKEASHGKFVSDCYIAEDRIPDWVTDENGKDWQKKVWDQLFNELERIQPGCLTWVQRG
ncbi:Short chain dehydrogenase FGM9 [Paramyrothecium foliicola]|nr:Short chain dehydrogenase FGM9 [Paramyrothecium foliicola]